MLRRNDMDNVVTSLETTSNPGPFDHERQEITAGLLGHLSRPLRCPIAGGI